MKGYPHFDNKLWIYNYKRKIFMDNFIKWCKKKMDKLNVKMKAKTGADINFALIFLGIFLFIVAIIVVKGVLGWVSSSLMG